MRGHLSRFVALLAIVAAAFLLELRAQGEPLSEIEKVKRSIKELKEKFGDADTELLKAKLRQRSPDTISNLKRLQNPKLTLEDRKALLKAMSNQGVNLVKGVQTVEDLVKVEEELVSLGLSGENREGIKGLDTTQIYRAMADKYKEMNGGELEAIRKKLVIETLRPLNEELDRVKALGLDESWITNQKNKIGARLINENNLGEEEFANQESYVRELEIEEQSFNNLASEFQLD